MEDQIKVTTKQRNTNHLNEQTNFLGLTTRYKILLFFAYFFIIIINILICFRMWKRIEITLKVWNITEIMFICISLFGIFSEELLHLQWSSIFMMFSFIVFSINTTIQGCIDIQKFMKDNAENEGKMKKILYVSLVVMIIMIGMLMRLWIINHISRAMQSITSLSISFKPNHHHQYYHNDKAKVTFPEVKPTFVETPEPDIV